MPDTDVTTTASVAPVSTLTITVFTRHSEECSKRNDPQWKRCTCRKSIYIYEGGKVTYKSAKTRAWEQAERVAQAERDKRDPVKVELARIAEEESRKQAAEKAKAVPLADALSQWIGGLKNIKAGSKKAYESTRQRILRWADSKNIVNVANVTSELLSEWHGAWSPDAEEKTNRLELTTQAALLVRLRSFFTWATAMEYTRKNPTLLLKAISQDESKTMPLTPEQFEELLAATEKYDAGSRYNAQKVGAHLRAIFLLQRWTGLRIGDVVKLPKSALKGNVLTLVTQKTGEKMQAVVPDHVVKALTSLPARKEEHPDYWFWSRKCSETVNTNKWVRKVRALNEFLGFRDEQDQPMEFRSHMLRDTFAVEMLLHGMPLEDVSKLLSHKSVKVTQDYYAKWTQARQHKLQTEVKAALRKMGATVGGD
jgi:site-specific recombinase XerD